MAERRLKQLIKKNFRYEVKLTPWANAQNDVLFSTTKEFLAVWEAYSCNWCMDFVGPQMKIFTYFLTILVLMNDNFDREEWKWLFFTLVHMCRCLGRISVTLVTKWQWTTNYRKTFEWRICQALVWWRLVIFLGVISAMNMRCDSTPH